MDSTFFIQNFEFKGILNYIYYKSNRNYPIVTSGNPVTTEYKLIDLIINPSTARIMIDRADSNQYIQFDLGDKYKSIITQYQIQTADGSPPVTWRIEASNSTSETFVQLANKKNYLELCHIYSTQNTQCSERKTTKFECEETNGPFRYFRFYVDLCTWGYYHNIPNDNGIRIGGFEIFGALFTRKEHLKSTIKFNLMNLLDSLTYPFFLYQL